MSDSHKMKSIDIKFLIIRLPIYLLPLIDAHMLYEYNIASYRQTPCRQHKKEL